MQKKRCMKGENNPFFNKKHTKKTKKVIGEKSKLKWTKEYREKFYRKRYRNRSHKDTNGYVLVKNYEHPNRNSHNDILEHILIMSTYLKRPMKNGEVIHHINFIRNDNNIKNLYLCKNRSDHFKINSSIFSLVNELLRKNIIEFKNGKYKIMKNIK